MNLIDFIIHVDKYIGLLIDKFGMFSYLILFVIIFAETGFVLTPFLPGDSLLFAAGAFAALGYFNVITLFLIFALASIFGDSVNYWIGEYLGEKFFSGSRFFKKEYLQKTRDFYAKYGNKTIFLARFVPIVRTFAPFVAGVGKMDYSKFLAFNVLGGIVWVLLFLFGGYFFGGLSVVQDNFSLIIIAIVILSFIPLVIEIVRAKMK